MNIKKYPLVSVVIPIYNVETFVRKCISSVFQQDYSNIEIIAVDDCGTDRSVSIVERLFENHPVNVQCILLHHECNRGLSAARNTGTEHANGKYILYLDSDDALVPYALTHLVEKIEESKSDVVVFDYYSDEENDNLGVKLASGVCRLNTNMECLHGLAKLWFPVTAWSKFLRKSFVDNNNLQFKEGIINEDAPWTFMLCLAATHIDFLHEELYYYRYNPNSIMSTSKQNSMNEAGLYTLRLVCKEIASRSYLQTNEDAYNIWMRQIVLFYTRILNHFKFQDFSRFCKYLPSFHVCFDRKISRSSYYKLWDFAFLLPQKFISVYLKAIIRLQSLL